MSLANFFFFIGTATDVAGEVVDVGRYVRNFRVGDKVVAYLSHVVSIIIFVTHVPEVESSWLCFTQKAVDDHS